MAKLLAHSLLLLVPLLNFLSGHQAHAVPYDHHFTPECLAKPLNPQYEGGIVENPQLDHGLKGWTNFGDAKVEHRESEDGNKFIVASNRSEAFHSFTQKFNLQKEKLYMFSAWLQVSEGNTEIAAIFKTQTGYETAGWVIAQKGCWSMLKGGLIVNTSGPAELYFESKNTGVNIMADSISLQPFTHDEWKSHQDQNVEKVRKSKVKFQAVDQHGQPLANATISIKQANRFFPFGCAINSNILNNVGYQKWFASKFKYTVFENEMKWYSNENTRGREDYSAADAMLRFAKSRGMTVRGHNIFWDDPKYQPSWVPGLAKNDLWYATDKRINSIMRRYLGQLIHWDVVNENLHTNFFESRLGYAASTIFYVKANKIDGRATPFLNEYNTIEESRDGASSPAKYLQKIGQIRKGYGGPLGIGVQGHFKYANLPYMRAALDQLASARLPIWVTELDVTPGPNQANYLEQVLMEAHAHPAVQGILLWSAWRPQGCYTMCLTDNNFRNLPTGNVVDKFLYQWSHGGLQGTTDSNGYFETSLFHGEYEAEISPLLAATIFKSKRFSVKSLEEAQDTLHVKINV